MVDASVRDSTGVPVSEAGSPSTLKGRDLRLLLPPPVSAARGLSVLMLGFALEGGTEVYQFLERGNLVQGALEYSATLATTLFGFYLMFLGLREWHAFHPKHVRRVRTDSKRRWPWVGLAFWAGGTATTALLGLLLGGAGAGATPSWIAWPVGGLVVLALGTFFFGLRTEIQRGASPGVQALGWAAFTWSLGVATVAGLVVGQRALLFLGELGTSWATLFVSVGPVVVAFSPLFVTYALMAGAYWPVLLDEARRLA
jgi:hypothetical protein